MQKITVLLTGAGGGGTNNLVASLRASQLDLGRLRLIGSNVSPEVLARSPLEENVLLPVATDPSYSQALDEVVRDHSVDLVIPNSDREVGRISEIRERLSCRTFLPSDETVKLCQDKYCLYERLSDHGLPQATTLPITSLDDLEPAIAELAGDRFWVRPRVGSGSKGATWCQNADQAKRWISLWVELRGYDVAQFTVSEFLPGRDYAFQSVWADGELRVAKMCERLSYFFGDNRLSGMSSTPAVARTIRDEQALEGIFSAVGVITDRPHGNFCFDLKERVDGTMCITECNVGRFMMITPIFDRTGAHNTAEVYVRAALGERDELPRNAIDIDEGHYLLRELDTLPRIVHRSRFDEFPRYPRPQ